MNEDMARIIATAGLRAARELGDLFPLLAEHCPDNNQLRLGLAAAIAEIGVATLDPAFAAFPSLKQEFDQRINRYGRAT